MQASAKQYDERLEATKNILIADDESSVSEVLGMYLESLGHNIHIVEDGAQAVDYYKDNANNLDAVILDMVMPELDGREAFLAMKEINADVPVIMYSGYIGENSYKDLYAIGIKAICEKPFRLNKMREAIEDVCAR